MRRFLKNNEPLAPYVGKTRDCKGVMVITFRLHRDYFEEVPQAVREEIICNIMGESDTLNLF